MIQLNTKEKIAGALWTVLGALNDAKTKPLEGIPNGHLYAQLMGSFEFETWQKLVQLTLASQFITSENHLFRITEKGTEFFKKLDLIYADAKALGMEGRKQEKARDLIRRMDEIVKGASAENRSCTPEEEAEVNDLTRRMKRLQPELGGAR